jgi:hypothetical protein
MHPTLKRASGIVVAVLPVIACVAVYMAVADVPDRRPLIEPRALAGQSVSLFTPAPAARTQTAAPELPLVDVSLPGAAPASTAAPETASADVVVSLDTAAPVAAFPSPAPMRTTLAPRVSPMKRGRDLTALLYANRLDQLWEEFQPAAQQEWGSLSDFQAYREGNISAYGSETKVLSETVRQAGSVCYYTRTATFERGPRSGGTVIFALDPAGKVIDFGIVAAEVLRATTAATGP